MGRGVQYFEMARRQGHPAATFNLAVCFHRGMGVAKDDARAAQLMRAAADAGFPAAAPVYAQMLYSGLGVPQDLMGARRYYKMAADRDDRVSQLQYANLCRQPGPRQDLVSAVEYLRQAHYNGEEVASCDYAMFLIKGTGVAQDIDQGIRIYHQAARFSRTGASQAALGSLYHTDQKMKDERAAAECFRQAAALRHFSGRAYWGLYLWKGRGDVPPDHREARRIFEELVANRPTDDGSLVMWQLVVQWLGQMCKDGEGGPVDLGRALACYQEAANMGSARSMVQYAEIVVRSIRDDACRRNARALCERAIRDFSARPQCAADVRRAEELLRSL
jgi:TPR repeat protein